MNSILQKYTNRLLNVQPEFGDIVETTHEEMKQMCNELDYDYSKWEPVSLAEYLDLDQYSWSDLSQYKKAVYNYLPIDDADDLIMMYF